MVQILLTLVIQEYLSYNKTTNTIPILYSIQHIIFIFYRNKYEYSKPTSPNHNGNNSQTPK
jgi:hypothetical protein